MDASQVFGLGLHNVDHLPFTRIVTFAEVWCVIGQIKKEGLVFPGLLEKLYRLFGDQIRGVASFVNWLFVTIPIGFDAVTHGEEVDAAGRVSVKRLETMAGWKKRGITVPKVPFADQCRIVALIG